MSAHPPPQRLGIGQLVSAIGLTIVSLAQLPPLTPRLPRTPFDVSAPSVVPAFLLLKRAQHLIPVGASVTIRSANGDPVSDTNLHRLAVALLPQRQIAAQALWNVPQQPPITEYMIIVGNEAAGAGTGTLILRDESGTVWRDSSGGRR